MDIETQTSVASGTAGQIAIRSTILQSQAVFFSHMLRLRNEDVKWFLNRLNM
jgi:hypothetical protein